MFSINKRCHHILPHGARCTVHAVMSVDIYRTVYIEVYGYVSVSVSPQVIGNGSEEEDSVAEALAHGALFAEDACYRRVTRVLRVLCAVARASPPAAPLAAAHAAYHSATLLTVTAK